MLTGAAWFDRQGSFPRPPCPRTRYLRMKDTENARSCEFRMVLRQSCSSSSEWTSCRTDMSIRRADRVSMANVVLQHRIGHGRCPPAHGAGNDHASPPRRGSDCPTDGETVGVLEVLLRDRRRRGVPSGTQARAGWLPATSQSQVSAASSLLRKLATVLSTTRSCPHCRRGRPIRLATRMAGWRISTVHAASAQVRSPSLRSRS